MDTIFGLSRFSRHGNDFMTELRNGTRHIIQWFQAFQAYFHALARGRSLYEQLGFDEGHRADLPSDVKAVVWLLSHADTVTFV